MELQKAIDKRRSIRKYAAASLVQADLDALIHAASMAPSWKNSQTRRYYAALSDEAKSYVANSVLPEGNRKKTADCAAYIISACKTGLSGIGQNGFADNLKDAWAMYDLGLSDMNLLLKAYELGYGSLVMGIRDADRIREYFKIPDDEIIVSVIAIGHADEDPEVPKRKALDEILKIF